MGYSSEHKTSSTDQQTPKAWKEKIASPQANRNQISRDNLKLENPFRQPYNSRHNELRRGAGDIPLMQLNSLHDHRKQGKNTSKDDELVKHMRNLPGYLQREEKRENLQGKALNFGVLDWGRLENWKSNEKRIPPRVTKKASSSTSKPPFIKSGTQGVTPSRGKLVQLHDSVVAPITSDREQKPCRQDTSSSNRSHINLDGGKRKDTDKTTTSVMEASSSDSRRYGSQQSLNSTVTAQDHCSSTHENVVLLLPKRSPTYTYSRSFNLSKPRTSFDEKIIDANEPRFSGCFSPEELFAEEPFSEIPHSCPLPIGAESNHDTGYPVEIPDRMSATDSSSASESSMRFYHDLAEQPAAKGRHPSPNRRFSFSLGKMTRSLSFKEGLGIPQLSSTYTSAKSGPVKSEASSSFDHLNRDKGNASGRSRSSPLRRLLDPLLKPKGAHSPETVQPRSRSEDLLQIKKQGSSCVQALLQLTVKNGVPFFKLVVDNSSDILAAAVKKLPTSGKDDSSLIYSFFSVHEIKKKNGGWIHQGSKEKSVGFGYNVVGQMKVSSSCDQYVVRESVLYSVDPGQADKKMPEFTSDRELAGIVVKDPSDENSCREGQIGKSTVVVLPGGVHSMPIHGVPSPLINRWRSGGSCDCGGWDVGCKLRVLTDRERSEVQRPSASCSGADRLDLFYQDEREGNKKSFSLALVKDELYSLEFDASISLLQAFSICVAVVSSQKLAHIFEVPDQLEDKEEKKFSVAMAGNDRRKAPNSAQGEAPAKYVSYPPASPVGRV